MRVELTDREAAELYDALRECLEIVRVYRESVADEDSIVLEQDLKHVVEILGLEITLP